MSKRIIKEREKPLALVVDDDISIRIAMQAALEKYGFEAREAANGKEALQMVLDDYPDLILLDVVMPVMDGFETCRAVRSLPGNEYIQVLMVTGLDDTDSIERAFQAGASGFVTKPINWTMLGHEVKYMLRAGQAFQELSKSRNRLIKTQQMSKLGSWEINLESGNFYCTEEAQTLHGVMNVTGQVDYDMFFSTLRREDRNRAVNQIGKAIRERKPFSVYYQLAMPNSGVTRHILNQGELLHNDKGDPEILFCSVQDVTELKNAEAEIKQLAFYDGLTGLANRMFFLNRLSQEIHVARRNDQMLALLYLDLDQFKFINDSFGHHLGDILLKKVAEVLQQCIRTTDFASRLQTSEKGPLIARLGGDEFTIILTDVKRPDNAAMIARRILKSLNQLFTLDRVQVTPSASIGISLFPSDGEDGTVLLKHADTAMYQAKKQGRNNYQFYIEEHNAQALERFSLEMDIPKALGKGEFELYYQPKIEVKSGRVVGAEALIRWNHRERGLVSPDRFIPIAEDSGQIESINEWVVNAGCKQWKQWEREGYDPGLLAVNLSGYRFAHQKILKNIDQVLLFHDLSPQSLEIEITENILMRDVDDTRRILNFLQDRGIRIAVDDFGTGYSSLNYLTSFKVDTLKVDRSFVSDCTANPKNLIIIKAIVAMGHSLGMRVVAEGVETGTDLETIREIKVDEAQGYYFSRPLPAEDFALFLKEQPSFSSQKDIEETAGTYTSKV